MFPLYRPLPSGDVWQQCPSGSHSSNTARALLSAKSSLAVLILISTTLTRTCLVQKAWSPITPSSGRNSSLRLHCLLFGLYSKLPHSSSLSQSTAQVSMLAEATLLNPLPSISPGLYLYGSGQEPEIVYLKCLSHNYQIIWPNFVWPKSLTHT